MTDEQKDAKYAYKHEVYRWQRAHGICYICGCADAVIAGLCGECYARKTERANARKQANGAMHNARYKAWREGKIAAGLCVYCGKRPAEAEKRGCTQCLAKRRTRKRIKDAEKRVTRPQDQCRWCEKKAVPGYRYCEAHLQQARESAARMRESAHNKQHIWRAENAALLSRWRAKQAQKEETRT